ncbi:hypothetical protein [Ruminococcus sp.]|uniref:hypothetical protein n=1 Tax=Ruminococcus sp. TaxID=41978 RepID=UPI003F116065
MKNTKNRVIAIITTAVITASIATTVCITGSALTNSKASTPDTAKTSATEHIDYIDGMPTPFTECKTIEEAQKISGVKFAVPEYSQSTILAYKGMIEIQIAKDEIHTIAIRKSAAEGDNTGLFGDYQLKKINIGDCEVTLKKENGKIYAAYFTAEDGTISISCNTPLKLSEVKAMLQQFIDEGTKAKEDYPTGESTGMPNPFIECNSLEEAAKIAQVNIKLPEYSQCTIYAVKNSFVEVQYPLNETSNITIRKSAGEEDISGVYDGKEMQIRSTDGVDVNVRLKDGKFISAYFTGDDGTYSITCDEPLEADEIIAIVDNIVSVNS